MDRVILECGRRIAPLVQNIRDRPDDAILVLSADGADGTQSSQKTRGDAHGPPPRLTCMRLQRATCSGGGFLIDGDAPVSADAPSGIRVRAAGGIGLVTVAAVMAAVVAPRPEGSPDETARISIAVPRAVVLVLDQPGGGRSAPDAPGLQRAATARLAEGF